MSGRWRARSPRCRIGGSARQSDTTRACARSIFRFWNGGTALRLARCENCTDRPLPPGGGEPVRLCVVGSLNMDLVVKAPRLPRVGETVSGGTFATFPGGKGANQAVAAA